MRVGQGGIHYDNPAINTLDIYIGAVKDFPPVFESATESLDLFRQTSPDRGGQMTRCIMAGGVFISYRRSDSAAFSGRIADFFGYHCPDVPVFFDTVAIQPGDNFVDVIRSRLASSSVVLAVMGESWVDAADAKGVRRIDNPQDFVRMELKLALEMGARVIPVLLDNAQMPDESQLPSDIAGLALCNAELVRGAAFQRDAQHLTEYVSKFLSSLPAADNAPLLVQTDQRHVAPGVKEKLVADFERYRDEAGETDFMIVENSDQKYVQFVKNGDGTVILDLPTQPLNPSQIAAASALLSESFQAETVELGGGDFAFQLPLPLEPAYLSHITLDVFQHVYGAIPDTPFFVTIAS